MFRWLPIVFSDFKRRTAGWHFVDLWTETFKIAAGKLERNFSNWTLIFSIINIYYTSDHSWLKLPVVKCSIFRHKCTQVNLWFVSKTTFWHKTTFNDHPGLFYVSRTKECGCKHFTSLSCHFHFSLVRFLFWRHLRLSYLVLHEKWRKKISAEHAQVKYSCPNYPEFPFLPLGICGHLKNSTLKTVNFLYSFYVICA